MDQNFRDRISSLKRSPRIEKLKKDLLSSQPELCSERARLVTLSYQETEGKPYILKRARALEKILNEMTVCIFDEELIVGCLARMRRAGPVFPEMGVGWLEKELENTLETRKQDCFIVSPAVKQELRELIPYWKGKTLREKVFKTLPQAVIDARWGLIFTLDNHEEGGLGHVLPDYPGLFQKGFKAVVDEMEDKIWNANLASPVDFQKSLFWKAAVIVLNAAVRFAGRYSQEAQRLAERESDPRRRKELEEIARICQGVPERPCRSFREAVQAMWFIHLIIQLETNGTAISPGRVDQHFYSYFQKDLEDGRLTLEDAQELIDCLWIKFNELIKLRSQFASFVHAGFPMNMNVTIGGQTVKGEDATNELTYLFLNAQEHVHLSQPQFSLRVHRKTPEELLVRAVEVLRLGGGLPQLISDEVLIASLMNRGIPLKIARNYAPIGCVEVGFIGLWGRGNGGYFNVPKVLELALNDGVDRLSGKKIGLATGNPREFGSFQEVMDAFKRQMEYCVKLLAIEDNVIDMIHAEIMPHVFISTMVPGCIEKGQDVTQGGALYNWTVPLGVGLVNAGNALAAARKKVFEEKQFSMEELIRALESNFEGNEILRQQLINAPKYGNDDNYVDKMVHEVVNIFLDEIEKYQTPRGGQLAPAALFSLSVSLPFGWATGASPDGRKAKEPLADGISPGHGQDLKGPTAILKSAGKIDHIRTCGTILNLKFHPQILSGVGNLRKFASLLRTYLLSLGGSHVQTNIVSADTLREAQKHPERYRSLVIRVTGYSAYFVELSKEVQNDIIERTEHCDLA